jgi:putative restriction endonuclease
MDYLHQLTRLRTDTNRTRWTEATAHRAPHKPFLLLSILDLVAQGQIDSPFITPLFWGDRNCMGRFS